MNIAFGWRTQKSCCFCVVAVAVVSLFGCSSSDDGTGQQKADPTTNSNQDIALADLENPLLQLRPLIDEAKKDLDQGNLDQAINKFTEILRHPWTVPIATKDLRAIDAEVLHLRGQAFMAKGFPQIAIDDFDDTIRFGNDELDSKAYVQRAMAEYELRRWAKVEADCSHSIRLNPNNGEAFLVRGRALEAMGKSSRAEGSFAEARRLGVVIQTTFKPAVKTAPSALVEAKISMDSGSPGMAREILGKAILDGNDSWETNGLLAQAQFELKEFYRAIVAGTRAIELNPQDADAYRVRGLSHFQRNSFDQAISDLKTAMAIDISLTEQLTPRLAEARRKGGIDPVVRKEVISRIRESVETKRGKAFESGQTENWLLELIGKRKSSEQVEQFKKLLAETPEAELDSLGWLADFLMLDYRVPGVEALRNHLDRKLPIVSPVEKRLWESVQSLNAATHAGVNVFPDIAAYAIEYEYLNLLQKSIDSEICRPKFEHAYQSIETKSSDYLELILPHVNLLDEETRKLLNYCMEKNRKDHAQLLINQHEKSLTWQVIRFLDILESVPIANELQQ